MLACPALTGTVWQPCVTTTTAAASTGPWPPSLAPGMGTCLPGQSHTQNACVQSNA